MSLRIVIYLCIALSTAVAGKRTRIIGGRDGSVLDYPYHANLRRISDNEQICGGAIVSTWHIVTTAHCVDSRMVNFQDLKITVGVSSESDINGSRYLPKLIKTHPKYTGLVNPETNLSYDVAVILLKIQIEFNPYQTKILLPLTTPTKGAIAVLTGWGATEATARSSLSRKIKIAFVSVLDHEECKTKLFDYPIPFDVFCGYHRPGVGVCHGDGGSPLVFAQRLIGLVYATYPYATGVPEIYINVFHYADFIRSAIRAT